MKEIRCAVILMLLLVSSMVQADTIKVILHWYPKQGVTKSGEYTTLGGAASGNTKLLPLYTGLRIKGMEKLSPKWSVMHINDTTKGALKSEKQGRSYHELASRSGSALSERKKIHLAAAKARAEAKKRKYRPIVVDVSISPKHKKLIKQFCKQFNGRVVEAEIVPFERS